MILEKLFSKRLGTYIDKYLIIDEGQYCMAKRTASLTIVDAIMEIASALDDKHHEFGTINHSILLKNWSDTESEGWL